MYDVVYSSVFSSLLCILRMSMLLSKLMFDHGSHWLSWN